MPRNCRLLALVAVFAAASTGCSLIPAKEVPQKAAPVERIDPSLKLIAVHLQLMDRLSQGTPAEQAEAFQAAKDAAEVTPNTNNRLHYALALATPGHGAANPELARQQLSTLLATPEMLLPAERTLAQLVLQNVEQRLILQAEIKRLQEEVAGLQRRRAADNSQRLQNEIEENSRLRKELAEAQAKLDEIARIERTMTERTPSKKPQR